MGIIETLLIAVSLGMDCFSVSLASGMMLRKMRWSLFLRTAFFFGLFQAIMPVIGWLGASTFSDIIRDYDHWVAFAMLLMLGINMIREGFKAEEESHVDVSRMKMVLLLAVATSIDALAVGVTLAFTGFDSFVALLLPVALIGAMSLAMSLAGSVIGALARRIVKWRPEPLGGVALIAIGIKILIEHLYY